ncbi:type-1 angiotensin II receptor-associated protein-like [Corticium candelabrum]|uniref:type-1 angiotensin II receptor-associated protein-like n=1 Tax=Corticium candelabrum TaxID=121492 RepID=UPI002E25ED89|nr:type-1 angiotensin II receptor-associated protein-like [Corticium candelabrum]
MTYAYDISNVLMLSAGLWATVERDKASTALFFFVAILINQLHEIVFFALYFDNTQGYSSTSALRFSAGMAIINHITKYVTLIFTFQHFVARGGSISDTLSSFRQYEPIDGSVSTDGSHGGGYHDEGRASGYKQYRDDSLPS